MELSIGPLTLEQAKKVCGWRYDGEYSVYNMPDWDTIEKQGWRIADPKRREDEYRSVLDENGELLGFFHLHELSGRMTLGLGLDPLKCGKGLGGIVLNLIIQYAKEKYPDRELWLDVREFNLRAKRCYEKAGFTETGRAYKETHMGGDVYITMRYVPRTAE